MKLSIVIPVCMQSEFMLRRCFDSILAQTEQDWEILAVNDAPEDPVARKLFEEYGAKDSRFHGLHQAENGGVSRARNRALDAVQGEYIGFVDADDAIQPAFYQTLLEVAARENCDMVSAEGYQRLQGEAPIPPCVPFAVPASLPTLPRRIYLDRVIWNRIYRRSVIADLRFSPELSAFEDMVYLCCAFLRCRRSAEIFYSGYCYYQYSSRGPRPKRKTCYAKNVHLESLKMLVEMRKEAALFQRQGLSYLILRRVLRAVLQAKKRPAGARNEFLQDWRMAWQESFCRCAEDFPVSSALIVAFLKLPYGLRHAVAGTLLRLFLELAALPENFDRLKRFIVLRRVGGMLSIPS